MIWHALKVYTGKEFAVSRDLRSDGLTVFLPSECIRQPATKRRPEETVMRALVPGYLFTPDTFIRHRHAYGYVSIDGRPLAISTRQMRPLFEATGKTRREESAAPRLSIGSIIQTRGTPFDGHQLTISRYDGDTYIAVTSLFGKPVEIPLHADKIAA